MSEPVSASWSISLDTDCPKCGKYVDLLNGSDFWDGRSKFQCGEHGTEYANALDVVCPECNHEFVVKCEW